MGFLEESDKISEHMDSITDNVNEIIVHPHNADDESIQFGSNQRSISFSSSSSSVLSDFSIEDLQVLDSEHDNSTLKLKSDNQHDENQNENSSDPDASKHGIPSHVIARKISTGPGNWSIGSHESLFSIRMGGTSFCHLDSFSPEFNLPYDTQFVDEEYDHILNKPKYKEHKGSHCSATSSSCSNSFVFPFLPGETEKGGSPDPRGSPTGPGPQSPPKPEPAPDSQSTPKASGADAETGKTTTFIDWTSWFPCFRNCACCC